MKIHHSKIYGYQSVMERGLSRFSLSSCGRYRRKTSLVPTSSPWFPLSPDRQAFACSLRQIACMSFRCSELKTWRVPSWSGPMQSAIHCLHLMTAQGFFFRFPSLILLFQPAWVHRSGLTPRWIHSLSHRALPRASASYTLTEWRTSANKWARSLGAGNELQ